MILRLPAALFLGCGLVLSGAAAGIAAQPDFGPPGGGPGGPGGPGGVERKILKKFDADGNGMLDRAERDAARADMKANPQPTRRGPRGGPGGGPGGPGGGGRGGEPTSPGPKMSPAEVQNFGDAPLYDTGVVRTLFFQFESEDWESELADFYNTDVEVPATLTVDGVTYPNVGVHFRGASSYFMVPAGGKRSLNVSMDMVDAKQELKGFRTLNLLNSHGDPSFMSTVLYSHLARPHIAAPRANFVRVVINGESWGTYVNVEQFNKDFVKAHFGSADGARWKVKGSPNGASGLDYIGDDIEAYKRRYQIKSKDRDEDWKDLANLCRVLSTTPLDELEEALKPILDIDGALWFLALDVALVNSDGYWVRASDYSMYKDPKGVFHIVPHDMNEAFASGGGRGGPRGPGGPGGPGGPDGVGPEGPRGERPGAVGNADAAGAAGEAGNRPRAEQPADGQPARGPRGGGPGGGGMRRAGVTLDPLVGMDDERKPLRSRLLAVPSLRAKYLEHVRELARDGMDWEKIGPVVAKNRALLMEHVKADTRKASSLAAFEAGTSDAAPEEGRPSTGLRGFFERRRAYLLDHAEIKKLDASAAALE